MIEHKSYIDLNEDQKALFDKAKDARIFAYAPYSKIRVGAALLTGSRRIYTGTNVENSSFSLTICAERIAVFKAVSDGERTFDMLALNSSQNEMITPCGACRQVLSEFGDDIEIIMGDNSGQIILCKLSDILPLGFSLK